MRLVVALGGNALLRRGEPPVASALRAQVIIAAHAIAHMAAAGHQIVVTHGNGPQVGLLALQNEAYPAVAPYPLDILGAESQGMIGYVLEQELWNARPGQEIATLLTQVEVDPDDPAFAHPSKPIGPIYTEVEAHGLALERNWTVGPDGQHWRRLVASPQPKRVIELAAIRALVADGITVICAGGGGIPVAASPAGALRGVEAVVDKDLSAALLATQLGADGLLLFADVDAVYVDWGTARARPLHTTTPADLRAMTFERGSMAPKVEAACQFVQASGRFAAIGDLEDGPALLSGERGTRIVPDRSPDQE